MVGFGNLAVPFSLAGSVGPTEGINGHYRAGCNGAAVLVLFVLEQCSVIRLNCP